MKEIRLKRNSKNGFLLGYGYIEMEDAESVETALTLDKKSFKGRTINVAKSEPKRTCDNFIIRGNESTH